MSKSAGSVGKGISIALFFSFAITGGWGCGNAKRTPYQGDPAIPIFELKPEDYCTRKSATNKASALKLESGQLEDISWGQGGGCIQRPIRQAWGALFNLEAMKWGGVTEFSSKWGTPPKHVSHFYEVRYVVKDTITVKWSMQWYHTVSIGDAPAPKLIWVNYKRVSGTQYIPYWEGTIYLQEVGPNMTAFVMRNQITAANTSSHEAGGSVEDVFNVATSSAPASIP